MIIIHLRSKFYMAILFHPLVTVITLEQKGMFREAPKLLYNILQREIPPPPKVHYHMSFEDRRSSDARMSVVRASAMLLLLVGYYRNTALGVAFQSRDVHSKLKENSFIG
jgi:hypothetical protein